MKSTVAKRAPNKHRPNTKTVIAEISTHAHALVTKEAAKREFDTNTRPPLKLIVAEIVEEWATRRSQS